MTVTMSMIAVEGTFGCGLYHHWTFRTLMAIFALCLGFISLKGWKKLSFRAFAGHFGLFLVLAGGLVGAPVRTDVQMRVMTDGRVENTAYDEYGNAVHLHFNISLTDFSIERYGDEESPRQFTSTLNADGRVCMTSVNHPCRFKGYRIYQSGYDFEAGQWSLLKITRDPWLPLKTLGALLLAISAILGLTEAWGSRKILVLILILAAVFTVISVAKIDFGTLPPALRSIWFVPHLAIYMLAYAAASLSIIAVMARLFTKRISTNLHEKLLSTTASLLLLGMLCGAVWADQAWGNFWTWDAKECWAAVTWLLAVAGTHSGSRKAAATFTIAAFIAIQVTWYGVNFLPSSYQSLHTYNIG